MIRLSKLLLEATSAPIAIFLAGSAGAGKSSFRKQFIDPIGDFTILNIDDEFEPLLQQANIPLDFRKYTSTDQLSAAGSAMATAQKIHRSKYEKSKSELGNIIIDGTGASSREVLKKKQELESLGYKTAMVVVFVPPDVSLQRNVKRGNEGGRTLMPGIILKSWSSLFDNIETYQQAFGDNFMIYKAYKDEDVMFKDFDPSSPESRQTFFDPFKVKGKEKSPEERAKSNQKINDLNNQIKAQLQKLDTLKFTDPKEITQKINRLVHA